MTEHFAALRLKPVAKGGQQRRGASLTGGEALAGGEAADIRFDDMEFGNAAKAFCRNFRAVAVKDLFQFAPGMGHTLGCAPRAGQFELKILTGSWF